VRFSPPQIQQPMGPIRYSPSWPRDRLFINDEHEAIFDATKDVPGWQHPHDSHKLYEIAYYSGQVILEIGTYGGRSAIVEITGALAGDAPVQFYGCDITLAAIKRTKDQLVKAGMYEHSLLYRGDVRLMLRDIPITPTMVFVDGDHSYEGVWSQLEFLTERVCPGTPVLCHDYKTKNTGVMQGVDEWIQRGAYEPMGTFGCSVLLRAGEACAGTAPRGLDRSTFQLLRSALFERALARPEDKHATPVADITEVARRELTGSAVC
jgi:Methyltransferase domain